MNVMFTKEHYFGIEVKIYVKTKLMIIVIILRVPTGARSDTHWATRTETCGQAGLATRFLIDSSQHTH